MEVAGSDKSARLESDLLPGFPLLPSLLVFLFPSIQYINIDYLEVIPSLSVKGYTSLAPTNL